MNVLLWLTHHIMFFLPGLQSSMTMSSCSQSRVWQYFYRKRRPAENGKGTGVGDKNAFRWVPRQRGCGWGASSLRQRWEEIKEIEIMARQKREGSFEGTIKFGRLNRTQWKRGQESEAAERCLQGRQPLLSSSHLTSPALSPLPLSRTVCRLSRSQVSVKWVLRLTALWERAHTHTYTQTYTHTHTVGGSLV